MNDARYASRCNNWFCESLNDAWGEDISSVFTNAFADFTTSFRFADIKFSLWSYQVIHRIGASGVVYGWMGMRVITSWMSPYHARLNSLDYFFLILTLAHDLTQSPISLEDLRMSSLLKGDGVDHAAHIMGFIFGMLWALIFILWEKMTNFGFGVRWRLWGRGRRLGARCEDEHVIKENLHQRRQNSRLLNQRGSNGQRPSDRVIRLQPIRH